MWATASDNEDVRRRVSRSCRRSGSQPLSGSVHEVVDRLVEVKGDSCLVVLQRLQSLVLRCDKTWRHEVIRASCHTVGDDVLVAGQMNEDDVGAGSAQLVTVAALEGRAGRHGTRAAVIGQPGSDGSQPGFAVLIGEESPWDILATFAAGCRSSPSRKGSPSTSANCAPMTEFQAPHTPMTTMGSATGVGRHVGALMVILLGRSSLTRSA